MSLPSVLENRLSIPVVGAPMFICSGPELVIEQCKAGIVGSFPALNARPQSLLDDWLSQINETLDAERAANPDKPIAPFAVNQICHASNDRLEADMETCVKHEVPIIISSLRPPKAVVDATHSYGGVVFHDVIILRHARKAISEGVDGIIATNTTLARDGNWVNLGPGLCLDRKTGSGDLRVCASVRTRRPVSDRNIHGLCR